METGEKRLRRLEVTERALVCHQVACAPNLPWEAEEIPGH